MATPPTQVQPNLCPARRSRNVVATAEPKNDLPVPLGVAPTPSLSDLEELPESTSVDSMCREREAQTATRREFDQCPVALGLGHSPYTVPCSEMCPVGGATGLQLSGFYGCQRYSDIQPSFYFHDLVLLLSDTTHEARCGTVGGTGRTGRLLNPYIFTLTGASDLKRFLHERGFCV